MKYLILIGCEAPHTAAILLECVGVNSVFEDLDEAQKVAKDLCGSSGIRNHARVIAA